MTDIFRVAVPHTVSPAVNLTVRSKHTKTSQPNGNPAVTTTYYAGAQEAELNNGQATVKTYWPYGLGVEIDQPGSNTSELNWSHHDRLGSIISISDSSGNLKEKLAYDSWGKRRTTDGSATPDNLDGQVDNKGYTGHEMLDQLDLVHMNGRIYDPLMARFLSADPLIQDPAHSQSYNRYTYVWNNPTNLTDPTGFRAADTGDLLSDTLTFLKSGLGFTESKSEPANEKPTTGGADNSGGQGKSSQTVTVTGSLAQARAEQWLLAKTIEAAYGKDFRVIKEPIIKLGARVAVRTGWRMTAGAFSGPAAPFVEGALIIGGVYELGKGIYDIVKKNEGGDTSAEAALSGTNSGEGGKSTNPADILTPDGKPVGENVRGAKPGVQTVPPEQLTDIIDQLKGGGAKLDPNSRYPGDWYNLPNGQGGFGIRDSKDNGRSLDLNIPGVPDVTKIHQR